MKFKNLLAFFAIFLLIFSVLPISAQAVTDGLPKVIDSAELLTPEQELELTNKIVEINTAYDFEVVIHTTLSCEGKNIEAYAEDYYDYNGYDDDGVILVIDMGSRGYYISTAGYGITAFTDYGIKELGESIVPFLSSVEYNSAFQEFLNTTVSYLNDANNSSPYDIYDVEDDSDSNPFLVIAACTLIAVVIGAIVTLVLRSGMNTARANNQAYDYIDRNSVNMREREDLYLYSNIIKTKIESNNHSGGSSVHRGSSGRSHGGGGGRF